MDPKGDDVIKIVISTWRGRIKCAFLLLFKGGFQLVNPKATGDEPREVQHLKFIMGCIEDVLAHKDGFQKDGKRVKKGYVIQSLIDIAREYTPIPKVNIKNVANQHIADAFMKDVLEKKD